LATIYVARHGQTDWNAHDIVQGQCQSLLNEVGHFEAYSLMHQLAGASFSSIISSDLKRAQQTAGIVALAHVGISVQSDPRLRECSYGLLEGLSSLEINTIRGTCTDEEAWEKYKIELPLNVAERFVAVLDDCESKSGTTLLLTHSGVMESYLEMSQHFSSLTHPKLVIQNTSYFIIRNREGVRVELDTSNLVSAY
jgi:broad specificity phosphatase PhoE